MLAFQSGFKARPFNLMQALSSILFRASTW